MASRYPFASFGLGPDADPFALLHDEMDRLFGQTRQRLDAAAPMRGGSAAAAVAPPMDVTETERELCIELDVPGVAREDLELSVDGDLLTLRGQRRGASHGEGAQPTLHLAERAHGRFERALRLPFAARTEHCQASLRDGVLTIRLAKADAQRKARRIEVQAAQTHAAPEQRTPLEPGQTELLDADPPAGGAAAQAARQARRGSPRAARQQDEPRAR